MHISQFIFSFLFCISSLNCIAQKTIRYEIPGTYDQFASRYALELSQLAKKYGYTLEVVVFEDESKTTVETTDFLGDLKLTHDLNLDHYRSSATINKKTCKRYYQFGIDLRVWYNQKDFNFKVPKYYLEINRDTKSVIRSIGKQQLPSYKEIESKISR